jgi:hypothetical protein
MGELGDIPGLERLLALDTNTPLTSVESRRTLRLMACEAARFGQTAMVKHLCEERNVPVHNVPEDEWPPDEVLHAVGYTRENNHGNTPLMGALIGKQEDLAAYLLDLPGQESVHSGNTLLHYACGQGVFKAAQILIERSGADMEARNNDGELPLCVAAKECQIPIVNLLLGRYRDMGPANLQEALERPCGKGGLLSKPLLTHVPRCFLRHKAGAPSTENQVFMLPSPCARMESEHMAAYLVWY